MSRVDGVRGELLALVSYLPRCQARGCGRGRRLPPIATFDAKAPGGRLEKVCGSCARRRSARDVAELPYRRLLRWLLGVVGAGQVLEGGGRTLTLVSPDGALADVAVLDDESDEGPAAH